MLVDHLFDRDGAGHRRALAEERGGGAEREARGMPERRQHGRAHPALGDELVEGGEMTLLLLRHAADLRRDRASGRARRAARHRCAWRRTRRHGRRGSCARSAPAARDRRASGGEFAHGLPPRPQAGASRRTRRAPAPARSPRSSRQATGRRATIAPRRTAPPGCARRCRRSSSTLPAVAAAGAGAGAGEPMLLDADMIEARARRRRENRRGREHEQRPRRPAPPGDQRRQRGSE